MTDPTNYLHACRNFKFSRDLDKAVPAFQSNLAAGILISSKLSV